MAAALLFLLNVYDLVITRAVLSNGGVEANPIMTNLVSTHLGVVVKVFAVGAVMLSLVSRKRTPRVVYALYAVTVIYGIVAVSNTLNYLALT